MLYNSVYTRFVNVCPFESTSWNSCVYILFHAISINLIKFSLYALFLGGRSVKINNASVTCTRRSIFQLAQFVLAGVGTRFIFNPLRLIIFADCENNCRRCKTSNGPRATRFLLFSRPR